MNRITLKEYFLLIAKAVAARATCLKRKYGCVIEKDGQILSTGYNGAPVGEENCCDIGFCDRLNIPHNSGDYSTCKGAHAEQNALLRPSYQQMKGGNLFLYAEDEQNGKIVEVENPIPCPNCLKLIKNAGIKKIINNKQEINLDGKN